MAEPPGLEPVADVLRRLQLVSSSAPALYLNEQLTRELFRAQLGAIESFTRAAGKAVEGGVGAAVVKVGASTDRTEQITYQLDDPLTQALLLHSALGGEQALDADARRPASHAELHATVPVRHLHRRRDIVSLTGRHPPPERAEHTPVDPACRSGGSR